MLALDFINVGNGDAALVREYRDGRTVFSLLIDCGHDLLTHPDERSKRIHAGDFLAKEGIRELDLLILTHFHRDHIGGLLNVLDRVHVKEIMASYFPPEGTECALPDPEKSGLPKPGKTILICLGLLWEALEAHKDDGIRKTLLTGDRNILLKPTEDLSVCIMFGEPALYREQKKIYDRIYAGETNRYEMLHWGKCMNISSLRIRLSYHGQDIVFGGDAYAVTWDMDMLSPCKILKVPHHASLSSTNRSFLNALRPETAVVSVASDRPDERPHPAIVSLLKEYAKNVYFTDAVNLPGLIKPVYHESVHLEAE
jgi:beta-lactamase superfamily II metal-dependent hydrolase